MRYYRVVITDPDNPGVPYREYSSLDANGRFIPGALNVEFDIPVVAYGAPNSGSWFRLWGIALTDISQSADMNDKWIAVYGGMSAGLPLANPEQQGLLCEGFIYQAFGNWLGTTQTLDFQILPGKGTKFESGNFTFEWPAGEQLAFAIGSTLQTAYPGLTLDVSGLSPDLVVPYAQQGQYTSLSAFAQYVNDLSLAINPATATGAPYSGAFFLFQGNIIRVLDNHLGPSNPKEIKATDLIGQPTWLGPLTFQFNCVLRGDLALGQYIKMPTVPFTTIPNSLARFRQGPVFQGVAQILGGDSAIRHVGNFRQPDAQSWITTVTCVVPPP